MSQVDLKKLKEEIGVRKKEKTQVARNLGEGSGTIIPKDEFLNGLLTSLKTGKPSQSTNLIKMVENKTAEKQGAPKSSGAPTMSADLATHTPTATPTAPIGQSPDREALLFEELERKKRELLAGGAVAAYQQGVNNPQSTAQVPQPTLNEEVVKNIINEQFVHIVEHAMKDAIVEIYAVERIKEVLSESEDMIRGVVLKTIRELQNKKKKTQS
jgi:hypothetical protein